MNEILKRKDGEGDLQYLRRLVYGKLVDRTLSDCDYTELSEAAFGQPYQSDVARRMFYGARRTLDILDHDDGGGDYADEIDMRISELRIEQQRMRDERAALNKVVREIARQRELSDIIASAVDKGDLPVISLDADEDICADIGDSDSALIVSLNDIHYGAVVDNTWRKYNPEVCAEEMESYAKRIIQIAKTHGTRECIVCNAGDSISGNIHRSLQVSNRENVIDQVVGVSELVSWFIASLAPHFDNVVYVSVAGNHSRIEADKKKEIVAERLDNLVGWYLEARLKDIGNVTIANDASLDETIVLFDACGKKYALVHGDFDGSASTLNALKLMVGAAGEELYGVVSGHLHHNKIDTVNGIKSIMGGSFLGMDEFCVQKRIVGEPEQIVCVVDGNGLVCSYDVALT